MSDENDEKKPRDDRGDRRPRRDRNDSAKPSSRRPSGGRPNSGRSGVPGNGRPARDGKAGERKPFNRDGARPARDGERKPFSRAGRPPRDGERKPFNRDGRPPARGPREVKPTEEFPRFRMSEEQRKAIRDKEPEIENWIAGKGLDKGVIRDLSTLSEDNAMVVGRHLEAAGIYAESDPERALQHAIAAKNRASRLAIVRETVGIMAYVNQNFTLALSELRTAQRISGSNDQAALIIDCLRALDRTDEGLKIARGLDRTKLPRESRIDLAIVLSGIRLDRGETDRAFAELQIPELDPTNATPESAQLFDANAEVLEELGRTDEAEKWRKYARMTEAHFTPDETIEFHTEYLETPTDVTDDDGADAAGETPTEEQS